MYLYGALLSVSLVLLVDVPSDSAQGEGFGHCEGLVNVVDGEMAMLRDYHFW